MTPDPIAITGICGERFASIGDFIRHVARCPRCALASRPRPGR